MPRNVLYVQICLSETENLKISIMGEESGAIESLKKTVISSPAAAASPPHFVFVHGIGGGAWCWYKLRCLMETSGYKVTCLDLKGAGMDRTDPNTVLSFHDYNRPLLDFLSSLTDDHQVILVGHSAGGLSLSDAINRFGKKKIKLAVFVAATMLRSGFVTDQDLKDGVPDLSEFGDVNEIGFGLGHDHPPTTTIIKREFQRKINYQLCPQEDSTLAAMLVRPGPVRALTTARFEEEADDANEVPRVCIKTTLDNVIKPEQQEAMIRKWAPSDVYVLETDHSPFFSAPFLLFGLLVKAAISVGY